MIDVALISSLRQYLLAQLAGAGETGVAEEVLHRGARAQVSGTITLPDLQAELGKFADRRWCSRYTSAVTGIVRWRATDLGVDVARQEALA